MSEEQVQVREGVWLTRDGAHVEVRQGDDNGPTQFRWVGVLLGINESWRDDGRWSVKDEIHRRDLVEYVGPLPAAQTTTDTLAEIEEQIAECVQQDEAHTLRAELAQATAARDSLEQQLATMQYERDILAQRLVTKHSEKALQKENSRKQIEINTLQDKLANMTSERDEVANELRAMTDHCSRQREQLESLSASRDQLAILLSNAQCAHDMMQRQSQQLQAEARAANELLQNERLEAQQAHAGRKRAEEHSETVTTEVQRLERELRQARIEIDAEKETPASNCKAIADAHLIGAQTGRQAAFEAVERWLEPLSGVDSEHAAAVLQALPGCIRKLAELEGVTW